MTEELSHHSSPVTRHSSPPAGRVAVLYHFFYPDDVVSAQQFTDLCLELQARGWEVEALASNRACHDPDAAYPLRQTWRGLTIRRTWRPRWRQGSRLGRVLNALWMLGAWCTLGLRGGRRAPDVVIVGT